MKRTNLAKKEEKVYNKESGLYNKRFINCYDEYNELSNVKKGQLNQKFNPKS